MQNIVSQVPANFTKVFYIPNHNAQVSHLTIYDISEPYSEKLGKLPMGSEDYKVELCILRKPNGERTGDNARFLVDFGNDNTSIFFQERTLGRDPVEAQVSVPTSQEKGFSFHTHSIYTSTHSSGYLGYPLPERYIKRQLVRYPYLTLTGSFFGDRGRNDNRYEWQVHPTEKGPLRYELVDMQHKGSGDDDSSVLAIYHHHGFESELPTNYSHGVLLLPSNSTSQFDIAIISSLLTLLSAVRCYSVQKRSRFRSLMACL